MASAGVNEAPGHHLVPSVPPPPIPSPLRRQRLRRQQQQQQQNPLDLQKQPPPAGLVPASVSRYRSLRGKSVSSVNRSKTFDVFVDAEDAPQTPSPVPEKRLRRRSKSAVSLSPSSPLSARSNISGTEDELLQPLRLVQTAPGKGPEKEPAAHPTPTTNANTSANARENATVTASPKPNSTPTPLGAKSANIALQPSSPSLKAKLEATRPADLARLKAITLAKAEPPKGHPAITPRQQEDDEAEQWAEEVARLEAETDRILAEQKKRDLARLQAQLATTAAAPKPKPRRLILDRLTIFTKGTSRASANAAAGNSSSSSSPSPSTPTHASSRTFPLVWSPGTTNFDRSPSSDTDTTTMAFFDFAGVGGPSAQMDAPVSASNGGERRVTVRCQSATINLPVTPETSPADIVYATANFITQNIDPATCVLVECFVMCGLERRLRRYERIRDVMNSWDRDQQNSLLVLPHDTAPNVRDLELAHVPRTEEPPLGFTFQLYHASRPGKWNKRWVTLMGTGQMFAAKSPDSKFTDKDGVTLCHLSDFDIYTPRESELRRHVKPPKKFCYAIKSQQKSNAFPNGENFVHFFSTEDSKLAHRFHELIHGWRSWYLANKKIDLADKAAETLKKSLSISHKSHKSRPSNDEKPYMIGDFKPLINMERFDKPIEEFGKDVPVEGPPPPPQPEAKEPAPRPKRAPSKAASSSKQTPPRKPPPSLPTSPVSNEGEFLSGGLLGDAYEKRKQAETVTTEVKKIEGPFTEGPSLLNGIISGTKSFASTPEKPETPSWFPSATEHTARARSVSSPRNGPHRRPVTADNASRQKHQQQQQQLLAPGPPGYPLPSRTGSRPGKGRGVRPPPNGTPLIDLANGNPMPSAPPPSRSASRVGAPSGGIGGGAPGGLINQPRRRATTTSSRSGAPHGLISGDRPPVPPLPDRSARRNDPRMPHAPHSRDQRPAEPLINRAK